MRQQVSVNAGETTGLRAKLARLDLRGMILGGDVAWGPAHHESRVPRGGYAVLIPTQWQPPAVALLRCRPTLSCAINGYAAAGPAVGGGSTSAGGRSVRGAHGTNGLLVAGRALVANEPGDVRSSPVAPGAPIKTADVINSHPIRSMP